MGRHAQYIIALEAFAVTIYIINFSLSLLYKGYSVSFISWLIAGTSFVGVFLGPRLGREIDKSRQRGSFLVASLLLSTILSLFIFFIPGDKHTLIVITALSFSVCANFQHLVFTQYVSPIYLQGDVYASYSSSVAIGATLSAILSFIIFDVVGPNYAFLMASISFFVCSSFSYRINLTDSTSDSEINRCPPIVISSFSFYARNLLLILSACAIASTVGALEANASLLLESLTSINPKVFFLLVIFDGIISYLAARHHPAWWRNLSISFRTSICLMLFTIVVTIINFVVNLGNNSAALSIGLFFCSWGLMSLSLTWWGIVLLEWCRAASEGNNFAETIALLKIPRSIASFLSVGYFGLAIDSGGISGLLVSFALGLVLSSLLVYLAPSYYKGAID